MVAIRAALGQSKVSIADSGAFMNRIILSGVVLLTACAQSAPEPARRYIPYDGYGSQMPRVAAGYSVARGERAAEIAVGDIGAALDAFLAPSGNDLILLPNRLDKSRLDFSIDSLAVMDEWLRDIHTINRLQADTGRAGEALLSDGRGDNSVMFAGLYLGEVVRANSSLEWHWQRFDTFVAANPVFTEHYGYESGLDSFVLVGPQGVATPINTALKRILFGKEESLQFIGEFLSQPVDIEAAMSGPDFYGLDAIQ